MEPGDGESEPGGFPAGPEAGDRAVLTGDIATILREKLIFSARVTVVDPGSLPKFEYKAKLVERAW